MPFTLIYSLIALVFLGVIFGIAYKVKGVKFALVSALLSLIILLGLLFTVIFLITNAMK